MSERNTTVCHTAFPILCAQCCIGVLMGFQIKSCSAQCWPSCKEPVVHPHISPMKKSHVKRFSPPPLFFSHYFFLFWQPVQPCSNKSKDIEGCTPSQWVVEPAGQLSIQLLLSLPGLSMPVPDPRAHTGDKEALVASRLPELAALSFNPVLYFIAQEILASGVRQGLDLLYKQWPECQEMWFVTVTALQAKIPGVKTKLSFNWGWRCGVVQGWLSMPTFSFCFFARTRPSAFMDISPIPVGTWAHEGRFQTHKVSCEQEMLEL